MKSTFISVSLAAVVVARPDVSSLQEYSFQDFLQEYKKSYANGTEYDLRKTIFDTRVASFVKHNSENHGYKMNVNKFADMSQEEINRFKGYNKAQGRERVSSAEAPFYPAGDIADSLDWRTKGAITPVKDQEACGSCWAFGSAETLESVTFIKTGKLPVLAPQQFVDCAPNPKHCGGTGGCEGSIPELAYGWLKTTNGMATEEEYPYTGQDGTCKKTKTPAATVTGFVNVPSNNYTAVMSALQGRPLAITVAAEPWQFYDSGVYNGCSKFGASTDLDHVVQLVGYGTSTLGKDYWLVRNSWGAEWGEKGYIRIKRNTNEDFCFTDTKPADGTGCTGGPSSVKACGSCGILYDPVYPLV